MLHHAYHYQTLKRLFRVTAIFWKKKDKRWSGVRLVTPNSAYFIACVHPIRLRVKNPFRSRALYSFFKNNQFLFKCKTNMRRYTSTYIKYIVKCDPHKNRSVECNIELFCLFGATIYSELLTYIYDYCYCLLPAREPKYWLRTGFANMIFQHRRRSLAPLFIRS
jgi:hypothetical protein